MGVLCVCVSVCGRGLKLPFGVQQMSHSKNGRCFTFKNSKYTQYYESPLNVCKITHSLSSVEPQQPQPMAVKVKVGALCACRPLDLKIRPAGPAGARRGPAGPVLRPPGTPLGPSPFRKSGVHERGACTWTERCHWEPRGRDAVQRRRVTLRLLGAPSSGGFYLRGRS